jgi:hypothetical protein
MSFSFSRWMFLAALACGTVFFSTPGRSEIVTFGDLSLGANSVQNGSGMSGGGFTSKNVFFKNSWEVDPKYGWETWSGWAYSNKTDATTPGYTNQFSAVTGSGYGGSGIYGVAYQSFYPIDPLPPPPTITLPQDSTVQGLYLTNTTYSYYAVRDGYGSARPFGKEQDGETYVDVGKPDWFKVTITGKNSLGVETGSVDFYLADYQSDVSSQDYIINKWTWVDLSDLKTNVRSLEFAFSSSDNDDMFGINTPTYVAMDNLTFTTVPEPSALLLLLGGVAAMSLLRARKRKTI